MPTPEKKPCDKCAECKKRIIEALKQLSGGKKQLEALLK
jgi:hypothetical protein